jgi:aspartyl-tRNA(Asn)/glutamyl-tRNA(Gln) amidotransferase subunit A
MSGSPELSIRQMASALRAGKTTSEMLTRAALGRIRAMDIDIHAFTNLDASGAMEAARNAQTWRAEKAPICRCSTAFPWPSRTSTTWPACRPPASPG